jgi:hypothetical protein
MGFPNFGFWVFLIFPKPKETLSIFPLEEVGIALQNAIIRDKISPLLV